jgi:hypothetical protein
MGIKLVIMLEDLNVAGMMKNRYLAQAISDAGSCSVKAPGMDDRSNWPTGPICPPSAVSGMGSRGEIELSEQEVHCPACGLVLGRDLHMEAGTEHQPVLDRFE